MLKLRFRNKPRKDSRFSELVIPITLDKHHSGIVGIHIVGIGVPAVPGDFGQYANVETATKTVRAPGIFGFLKVFADIPRDEKSFSIISYVIDGVNTPDGEFTWVGFTPPPILSVSPAVNELALVYLRRVFKPDWNLLSKQQQHQAELAARAEQNARFQKAADAYQKKAGIRPTHQLKSLADLEQVALEPKREVLV